MKKICDENCFFCPYDDCIYDDETRGSVAFSNALDLKSRYSCFNSFFGVREYFHMSDYLNIKQSEDKFFKTVSILYGRCYYLEHREERLIYGKSYYLNNREQRLNYQRDYYRVNSEKRKEYQREYYKLHKDEIAERRRQKRKLNTVKG